MGVIIITIMIPIPNQEYIDSIPKEESLPPMTKEEKFEASIDAEISFFKQHGYYAQ